jgi:hypothetical protein
MTKLGPILPVQLLQQSKICPSSVFHIHRTRQTSPPVTFMSLDCSERWWEDSVSGPKKAGGAWVAVLSAKRIFSSGIHAHPNHWNTCMVRNGDYVQKWSDRVAFVFNKLRDTKYLRFSFEQHSVYIYIYIYICVCVCVCVSLECLIEITYANLRVWFVGLSHFQHSTAYFSTKCTGLLASPIHKS